MDFRDHLIEQLKDPNFADQYSKLAEQYQKIEKRIIESSKKEISQIITVPLDKIINL